MTGRKTTGDISQGFFKGDKLALARAISAIENEHASASKIMSDVAGHLGRAAIIGITGPPGAGKSTLTSALTSAFRGRGLTVGVVAVDPSSPLTGGAILGDRIRMTKFSNDDGVFIRSLASRGSVGGLSRATSKVAHLMDAAGFDIVLIETVGAGQSEVEIMNYADVTVVVSAPGLGDEIQAFKAGILEIADILVVNKADLEYADITVQQLKGSVALGRADGRAVEVLKTVATTHEGVELLADAILDLKRVGDNAMDKATGIKRAQAMMVVRASEMLAKRLQDTQNNELMELAGKLAAGEIDLDAASQAAINAILHRDTIEE